jgi:hypothetical protein
LETKRFIGSDMTRLLERVRREFGADAVLVSTRTLSREDAAPLTEVVAAPPGDDPGLALDFQRALLTGALARLGAGAGGATIGDLEDLVALEEALGAATSPADLPAPEEAQWLEGFVANAPPAPAGAAGDPAPGQEAPLHSGLPSFALRPVADLPVPGSRGRDSLAGRLVDAGFSEAAAAILAEESGDEADPAAALVNVLGARDVQYPAASTKAIVTIQGPAGSGRTTALIRMALDCLDSGRQALLVAADSTHTGAREQIHAYADAMGLHAVDAFDASELLRVAAAAPAGLCLFVDWPPRPWAPPDCGELPAAFFPYLALPAHWQPAVLEAELAPYDLGAFAGCIPTFTDLATDLSPVLSAVVESRLGVAFLSSGRDVSTGIEVADLRRLASGIWSTRTGERADVRLAASA